MSERWCELPPVVRYGGPDEEIILSTDGHLLIDVRDLEPRSYREQPADGWGCLGSRRARGPAPPSVAPAP